MNEHAIRLRIDRLVLRQVPPGEHPQVIAAFREHLQQLVLENPSALAALSGGVHSDLSTTLTQEAFASGTAYGAALAHSVYKGFTP